MTVATDDSQEQESTATKASAQSTSAKKTAPRKTTKKSPAKKTTAKKTGSGQERTRTAPRKSADGEGARQARSSRTASAERGSRSARSAQAPSGKPRATEVAGLAARQLLELTGREPEGVTGLERTEDGWRVSIDVLELRRVPETTDVLACYEVDVDERGDLTGYRRVHRYVRGSPGEEGP